MGDSKKLKGFLKWALAFYFLLGVYLLMAVPTHGHRKNGYGIYISRRYMPAQKSLTGKWPTDLNGVNQQFHRDNFERLEMLKSDGKSCQYILHLKGYWPWTKDSLTCQSNLSGGSCHW